MNVEAIEVSKESNASSIDRPRNGGAKRHASSTRGWVGVGVGVGAAVALAVLRGRTQGRRARALTWAGAAVTGATLVDTLFLVRGRGLLRAEPRPVSLRSTVTIRRSRDDIYRYWRELGNLAVFMRHVDSVSETNGHSVWRAWGPAGLHAEWEAEIVADRPGERIAWRSLEGATVPNRGAVEFRDAPGGQGTEVHLELVFEPPAGSAGAAIARLFAALPEQSMKSDLRRLKQLLETGEIVCSDASIHRGTHPARPPEMRELPLVNGMVRS
jgi:uncharacterized membrane protein